MSICINDQVYSLDELHLVVALHLYLHLSDETIGSIIATRRTGYGSLPIACNDLTPTLQDSSHTAQREIYAAVCGDQTCWEARAREVYRRWMDGCSQIVQRLSVRGVVGEYLDTRRG